MRPMLLRRPAAMVALASVAFGTSPARGSGFELAVHGASGFAGAGAAAEDASTVWWNPAGMSKLPPGEQVVGAVLYIRPSIKFSDGGSTAGINRSDFGNSGGDAGRAAFVPNAYFAMDLSPTVKFGLGIDAPFGLRTEYDPAWVGRFQGIRTEIKTVNVNPSISWKASDAVALGFGVDYQIGKISSLTAVNYKGLVAGTALDPAIAANAEGQNQTDVDGDAWGFNLGALFDLGSDTRLGVAYRSSLKYKLSGTTRFSDVPAAFALSPALTAGTADGNVNLSIKTPDSLSLSLAHQASPRWTVLADATRTGWSRIQSLPLVRDTGETVSTTTFNFKDTMRYAVGANYKLNDDWTLKTGLARDQSPVPSAEARTVKVPDSDRTTFAFGAKRRLSGGGAIDVGYSYVKFKDAPINNVQNDPAAGQVAGNVVGSYKSSAQVVGVQYAHLF